LTCCCCCRRRCCCRPLYPHQPIYSKVGGTDRCGLTLTLAFFRIIFRIIHSIFRSIFRIFRSILLTCFIFLIIRIISLIIRSIFLIISLIIRIISLIIRIISLIIRIISLIIRIISLIIRIIFRIFSIIFLIFSIIFRNFRSKPKSSEQCASESMIDYLVEETNGLKLDIEVAMATFLNKERRKKKPFPWKVDLEIGSKIKIPVVGYVGVRNQRYISPFNINKYIIFWPNACMNLSMINEYTLLPRTPLAAKVSSRPIGKNSSYNFGVDVMITIFRGFRQFPAKKFPRFSTISGKKFPRFSTNSGKKFRGFRQFQAKKFALFSKINVMITIFAKT
jgi:hypothetical protein